MNKKRLIIFLIVVVIMIVVIEVANSALNKLEENITNTTEAPIDENTTEENISEADDYFILYTGKELEIKTGIQNVFDNMIGLDPVASNDKYNTTYYNFEKNRFTKTTQGKFEYQDGYVEATNVGTIAISEDYNAIPRQSIKLDEIPEQLQDMMDYPVLEIEKVDLDGDEKEEYIVCTNVDYARGEIGDGEPEASSDVMLFDSDFNKVSDLVTIKDGFTSPEKDEKAFLSLDRILYVDIDKDGVMEILIDVPTYEEMELDIFKYTNGKLEGEPHIIDRILP